MLRKYLPILIALLLCGAAFPGSSLAQANDDKALAVIAKAVQQLGGDRYLNVTSEVGRGSFSQLRKEGVASYQTFTDAIIFPDKERTDFKGSSRSTQVNTGDTGWIYDGDQEIIKIQTPVQIENFKRGLRTSLDTLLRGAWKGQATLSYVGRRQGGIGKRNDVVRLTYSDGFAVEFEFDDSGTPVKAVYTHKNQADDPVKDEDRYAQFVDFDGIKTALVVDHYLDGQAISRINYDSFEFNKHIPDSIFRKPSTLKEAKKDVKY
jgi:outer membrane lipoprotein-sorting protein